jgi:hypothetical protein
VTGEPPPGNTPQDPISYRMAVGAFGLALLAFVIVAGIAVAVGAQIPDKFWVLGTSIAGILAGILVPPTEGQKDAQEARAQIRARAVASDDPAAGLATAQAGDTSPFSHGVDWRLVVLGVLFAGCGIVGLVLENTGHQGATQLFAVAGATGAAALGILIPSPKATA